jgi:hypothetical protein
MFSHADRCAEIARRRQINSTPWRWWQPDALRPVALQRLGRHERAMELFLEGLRLHWFEAMTTGRREAWGRCMATGAALMASADDAPFVQRRSLDTQSPVAS